MWWQFVKDFLVWTLFQLCLWVLSFDKPWPFLYSSRKIQWQWSDRIHGAVRWKWMKADECCDTDRDLLSRYSQFPSAGLLYLWLMSSGFIRWNRNRVRVLCSNVLAGWCILEQDTWPLTAPSTGWSIASKQTSHEERRCRGKARDQYSGLTKVILRFIIKFNY